MDVGERIQVQTKSFKGMATILYIAPGEYYPVQVEMDEPDPDGHKIYRVASHEIVDELPAKNETPIAVETSGDPEQLIGEVVQEESGYSFRKGQRFLLEKRKPESLVYYIYEQETNKFRGCMPLSMFNILSAFESLEPLKTKQEAEETVESFIVQEELRYEQMSLLDFL